MRHVAVLALILGIGMGSAEAQIITSCSELAGRAYYFPGGLVPRAQSGWQDDKITNGLWLFSVEGGKPRIKYRDATRWMDPEEDGGTILVLPAGGSGFLHWLVAYEKGIIEAFLLRIDGRGAGEMVMTVSRPSDSVAKVSIMRAVCSR